MGSKSFRHRLRYYPVWLSIGIGLILSIIYLSLVPAPPKIISFFGADKVSHLLAYAVLTGWFGQLYLDKKSVFGVVVGFIFMGILLEILQGMTGYRMFDYADMLANTLGVFLGLWLTRTWFAGFLYSVECRFSVSR